MNKDWLFSIFRWLVIGVVMGSLVLFMYHSDWHAIGRQLQEVGIGFGYIILVTGVAFTFGSLGWYYLIPDRQSIPFWRLHFIRLIGDNFGLLNPTSFIGGDSFKGHILKRDGHHMPPITSAIILHRILMLLTQIMCFLWIGVCYALFVTDAPLLLEIIGYSLAAIFILLLIVTVSLIYLPRWKFDTRFQWLANFQRSLQHIFHELRVNFKRRKKVMLLASLCCVLNWLIGSAEIWLIFYYLGLPYGYWDALFVDQGVLVVKSIGSFVPAQAGVEEYSNKLMLSLISISSTSIWVSLSILRRARQLFWILICGVVYYFVFKLRRLPSQNNNTHQSLS